MDNSLNSGVGVMELWSPVETLALKPWSSAVLRPELWNPELPWDPNTTC